MLSCETAYGSCADLSPPVVAKGLSMHSDGLTCPRKLNFNTSVCEGARSSHIAYAYLSYRFARQAYAYPS